MPDDFLAEVIVDDSSDNGTGDAVEALIGFHPRLCDLRHADARPTEADGRQWQRA